MLTGTRILVTGASGFIGKRLAQKLASLAPQELRFLVRDSSSRDGLAELGADFVVGSLQDRESLDRATADVDWIFHLAGLTRAKTLAEFIEANAQGVQNLAQSAQKNAPKLQRLLYVSSLAGVGPAANDFVDESTKPSPVTFYGESKQAGEGRLQEIEGPLKWTIVRPPAVYGPGEKDILTLFQMVARGFAPRLGFSEKFYSFVYVDDLVDGMLAAATHLEALSETYFLSHPEVVSNLGLLAAMEQALGCRAWKPPLPELLLGALGFCGDLIQPFLARPPLLTSQRMRELRPKRWVCSAAKAARELGFECQTPLSEGLRLSADWYREKGWLKS